MPTSSIVPTSTRFMWRMKLSASIQNSSNLLSRDRAPAGGEDVAGEADMVGLGRREGGEVVGAGQRRRARLERAQVEATGASAARDAARERTARLPREQPVAVGAAGGIPAGVEARRRGGTLQDRDVVGEQRVERVDPSRLPGVARHLPAGVNPGVGAPGDGQRHLRAA